MTSYSPHYLLFCEASGEVNSDRCPLPTWRFVLQPVSATGNAESRRLIATDSEPCDCGERLELLAVVRGLEALDGPSRVTLVTKSRYVSRGIKKGLAQWRDNDWKWERFGRIVPVRDHDLWQRVDRALQFHEVTCQAWQFETVEVEANSTEAEVPVITPRTRRRFDSTHHRRAPRIAHRAQRLKRRAKTQASNFGEAFHLVTRPLREAVGTAT